MGGQARAPLVVAAVIGLLASSAPASAQRHGDGLYGRWDRAFTLSLGAGPSLSWIEQERHVGLAGELRFLIGDMAGLALGSRWGPDAGQYLFLGVDLRPLFPGMFALDLSIGHEFADLLIQSLYLELGPAFLLDGDRSVGLGVGFGFSIPLYRPLRTLRGLWLRVGARHVNADTQHRQTIDDVNRSEWTLFTTFVVRLGIKAQIGRWETPSYRR